MNETVKLRDYTIPVVHDPLVTLTGSAICAVCTCGAVLGEWDEELVPLDDILDAVDPHCSL